MDRAKLADLPPANDPRWTRYFEESDENLGVLRRSPAGAIKMLHNISVVSKKNGIGTCLANYLESIDSRIPESELRLNAQIDQARMAIALCSYRARHGKLPDQLEDLRPEFLANIPKDPYDGEELRYDPARGLVFSKWPVADNGFLRPLRDIALYPVNCVGEKQFGLLASVDPPLMPPPRFLQK